MAFVCVEASEQPHSVVQKSCGCRVRQSWCSGKTLLRLRQVAGFPYIAVALFLSIRFLMAAESFLCNDLFWADFNATIGGVYVANAFNQLTLHRPHHRVQLTSREFATFGIPTTSTSNTAQIKFTTTYVRALLFHRLNTPQHAIMALRRKESTDHALYQQTQFCWVDFNRTFSLAHTTKRAKRCFDKEQTNGAVYLESYLRNLDATRFLESWQTEYTTGIASPLRESSQGRLFLDRMDQLWKSSSPLSVAEEVAHWQVNGITHFTMQWGNRLVPGITERIEFVSALGRSVQFTIKTLVPLNPGKRTTMKMFWTPANDLLAVGDKMPTAIAGLSLVRGTSKFFEKYNISMEQVVLESGMLPSPMTPQDQLLRDTLGPFGSIDIKHVMQADSLFTLVLNSTRILHELLLRNPESQALYNEIPESTMLSVFPLAWRPQCEESSNFVWSYLGGNPLCSSTSEVPYALESIEYSDGCLQATQMFVYLTRLHLVISLLVVQNSVEDFFESICHHGTMETERCVDVLNKTSLFIDTFLPESDQQQIKLLAEQARQDVLQVNPEFVQFVVNNSNRSHVALLHQPVLAKDPDDLWNVFGWWHALQWSIGDREVIHLEGDDGSLTLMSGTAPSSFREVGKSEIPSSMSLSFLRVVQYTTMVSILCASLAIMYALASRGHVAGANLLGFYRVVGAVWIGRPLLIVRGTVAVVMISTSHVLLRVHGFMTLFEETREPWYNVLIAAGESCWLSYVTTDIVVIFTQGYTHRYALLLAALFTQVLGTLVQLFKPFKHRAEINLQCEMTVFYEKIVCQSGLVEIGNLTRLLTIVAMGVGATLLILVTMRVMLKPLPPVPGGNLLLAGISKEVYSSSEWIHDGQWYLDRASAVMSGLVTIPFGRCGRVLDVKTWTLLYLKNNRLYDILPCEMSSKSNQLGPGDDKHETTTVLPKRLRHTMALTLSLNWKLKSQCNLPVRNDLKQVIPSPQQQQVVMPVKPSGMRASTRSVVPSKKTDQHESLAPTRVATDRSWSKKKLEVVHRVLGLPYVVMTLLLSLQFLVESTSTLKTDLFWPDFNSTRGGLLVARIFNTMLLHPSHKRVVLTNPEFAMLDTEELTTTFSLAYARTVLFHRINTPKNAINSLRRKESTYNSLWQTTLLCWVDFDRHFSLAHTVKRAERCLANDITNGAVYLESFLRNSDGATFLDTFGDMYLQAIDEPLQESTEGNSFRDMISEIWNGSKVPSVDDEVAYWNLKGITHFTMQWGNSIGPGVTERIELVNVLQVAVNLTIKAFPRLLPGQGTTIKMNWLPGDDLWATGLMNTTAISGLSLIRGTSKFYENFGISMEQVIFDDGILPIPLTPIDQMVRDAVGPFGAIDVKQLLYPDSLIHLVLNTTRVVNQRLLSNPMAQDLYRNITEGVLLSVFPIAWRPLAQELVWSYLGGSPLCSLGVPEAFAQKLMEYSHQCVGSTAEMVQLSRTMLVVSLLATGNPFPSEFQAMCESGTMDVAVCVHSMEATSRFIHKYLMQDDIEFIHSLAMQARKDVLPVNPELIQFAVNNSNASHLELLHQPLLSADRDDPWNVFGWWYAIGWATGHREVVRFEGDHGTLTLISAQVPSAILSMDQSEIPSSMSSSLLGVVQYTTLVFLLCASMVLVYAVTTKGGVAGANMWQFNRVSGAVWIGRPLLIARGIVAVCMLSSSHVLLQQHGSLTKFDEPRRSWYNVIIAAGESCWLSYVTTDLLTPLTKGYTYPSAIVSGLVSQWIIALVDFMSPFEHQAVMNLQCEEVVFGEDILCHSGRVQIGSLPRLITVVVLPIGVTLVMMLVMRCMGTRRHQVEGSEILLAGIAKEMYRSDGWVHEGRWYLDKASALLTGLVTVGLGRHSRVLDVKTWTLLDLHQNRLYDALPPAGNSFETPTREASRGLPQRLKDAMALTLGFDNDAKISREDC